MSVMELLAPAGTIDTFHAAIDGGADAVYVGAPGFNARNLSRELQLEEIAAMLERCRSLGKKLYIAANSLVYERELGSVLKNLAIIEALEPDGLIVQDLGIVRLVRKYFPGIPLHGSTLMTVHNSDGVKFLEEQGFERVVVAREMTLKEIETVVARAGNIELEVFIHGAMCFSFSGLCLFSSYLGGKSGLRGRCVQPCRRGYASSGGTGRRKGPRQEKQGRQARERKQANYLFSMNDLTGLEAVPHLRRLGISSLKIEGRLRSVHYVKSVVQAYRIVIDASEDNTEQALLEAERLVDGAMSRKTTTGYFFSPQPAEAITSFHSGNMGLHLGRFSSVKNIAGQQVCRFTTKDELCIGDRLRLHKEPSGDRQAFRVKTLFVTGEQQEKAAAGEKVSIGLPSAFSADESSHVEVYKIDGPEETTGADNPLELAAASSRVARLEKLRSNYVMQLSREICLPVAPGSQESKHVILDKPARNRGKKAKNKVPLEWWMKIDSVKALFGRMDIFPDRYLLPFDKQLLAQAGKIKKGMGRQSRLVTWALPPVIFENDIGRVKKQLQVLIRTGFKSFQLGHISQMMLFKDEKVHLFGDFSLNVMNSQAVAMFRDLGGESCLSAIELDREKYRELFAGYRAVPGKRVAVGIYAYGAPPLYTSRIAAKNFQYGQKIESPRQERYVIRKREGYTQTFPEKPFSLLPYTEDLKSIGASFIVVDCTGFSSVKAMEELFERLRGTGRYSKLSTFNYLGELQ